LGATVVPEPEVALATPSAQALLAGFICSRGDWYDDDVQHCVRTQLTTYDDTSIRTLLFFIGDYVAGVVCHQARVDSKLGSGDEILLLALSCQSQGSIVATGGKLSEYVLRAALRDAQTLAWGSFFWAQIACDNKRSLNLFHAVGFVDQQQLCGRSHTLGDYRRFMFTRAIL
jgi:hypothetical protein